MNKPTVALDKRPFLLVSDVHCNAQALEQVLDDAPDVRYRCFLGDAVDAGDNKRAVLDMISDFDVCVMGNHDALAIGDNDPTLFGSDLDRIARQHALTEVEHDTISQFVKKYARGPIMLMHGTTRSCNDYILNERDVRKFFFTNNEHDIYFGGHLHVPRIAAYHKKTGEIHFEDISEPFSRHPLNLKKFRYLINCPSVSMGRVGSKTGYCTVYHHGPYEKILNMHLG